MSAAALSSPDAFDLLLATLARDEAGRAIVGEVAGFIRSRPSATDVHQWVADTIDGALRADVTTAEEFQRWRAARAAHG